MTPVELDAVRNVLIQRARALGWEAMAISHPSVPNGFLLIVGLPLTSERTEVRRPDPPAPAELENDVGLAAAPAVAADPEASGP